MRILYPDWKAQIQEGIGKEIPWQFNEELWDFYDQGIPSDIVIAYYQNDLHIIRTGYRGTIRGWVWKDEYKR